MNIFGKKKKPDQPEIAEVIRNEVNAALAQLSANANTPADLRDIRTRIAAAISGGYDYADTLHNIYLDFGYPQNLEFFHFWNMYRRFGIAKNIVELPVDVTWLTEPEVEGSERFNSELKTLVEEKNLWIRLKGLDNRQRVGRFAALFMRVRDGKSLDQPLEMLPGAGALVDMKPVYEGALTVLETDNDPTSDTYGEPTMYQMSTNGVGNRDERSAQSVSIHPSRLIIAAEGADDGSIYGVPALEAAYNSLMDLRKIIGAGGEGFYKNAAQSLVFKLDPGAASKDNATLLARFNDEADDFMMNRARRSLWTPGMDAKTIESNLANPKDFFMNALNDVAASAKIPATILIGQQTGRLASNEDGRSFLSGINSRRRNWSTEMIGSVIDWCMKYGILPRSDYEIEWDDLLALGDSEKLDNALKMSEINAKQFASGGSAPFTGEEIREAGGYEVEEETEGEEEGEDLPMEEEPSSEDVAGFPGEE